MAKLRVCFAVLLILVGSACLLYPVVATFAGNLHCIEVSRLQAAEMADMAARPEKAEPLLADARAYNRNIRGIPILDPYLHRMSQTGSAEYNEYLATLAGPEFTDGVIGRLIAPTANIDLPIRHGTEDDAITRGAGHLFGTALPVGGIDSNAVLTAHSGMITASLFDGLRDIAIGDVVYVQVAGQTLAYRVNVIKTIEPTDLELFHPKPGRDILTLFTCTPYGINTHRLVVSAERISLDQVPEQVTTGPSWWDAWRGWMAIPVILVAIGWVFGVRHIARSSARQKFRTETR